MSRTYRRKSIKECEINQFGYLDGEFDTYSHFWSIDGPKLKWDYPAGHFANYDEYRRDAISRFYRDCDKDVVLHYNRSPWVYRNRRNRILRRDQKQQITQQLLMGEYDVVIDPFTKNSGWDYW